MTIYKDTALLKTIGAKLKSLREEKRLLKADIACRTGFTPKKIKDIEEGNEISLSYFTEVCKALEVHPRDILDFEITLEPRNVCDKAKNRITNGVKELIADGYFDEARKSSDVKDKLEEFDIETTTSNLAVILKRQVDNDTLESRESKTKGTNEYIEKVKPKEKK